MSTHVRGDNNKRLRKLERILADGTWHGTLSLTRQLVSCAVHTDIFELRRNLQKRGYTIERRCVGRGRNQFRIVRYLDENWNRKRIGRFTGMPVIVSTFVADNLGRK